MENKKYEYRRAKTADIPELKNLYQETLHTINRANYTAEEIEDWASCGEDIEHLQELIDGFYFIVTLDAKKQITGFAAVSETGFLHSLFVHKDHQREGVASFLLQKAEMYAREHKAQKMTSEVCITARPFFERKGYVVIKEQKRKANRLYLTNYQMEKIISGTL